jgi:hypothetical protein
MINVESYKPMKKINGGLKNEFLTSGKLFFGDNLIYLGRLEKGEDAYHLENSTILLTDDSLSIITTNNENKKTKLSLERFLISNLKPYEQNNEVVK